METRNPVQGYFASEFPAICNDCLRWNFQNFVLKVVITIPNGRVVLQFCEIWLTAYVGGRTDRAQKSARASPRQCTQSAPDFIQIGLLSEVVNEEEEAKDEAVFVDCPNTHTTNPICGMPPFEKKRQIPISPQRFDQLPWVLASWCTLTLLKPTGP